MSDDRLFLNVPAPRLPSVREVEVPGGTLDLAKERELRKLRHQVESLTAKLATYNGVIELSQITTVNRYEDRHGYKCGFHPRVIVSEETRSVTCQACGAELEPMDVLREFARNERRFVESVTGLRQERAKLLEDVAELKKRRSSLRSQVKKKGGTV